MSFAIAILSLQAGMPKASKLHLRYFNVVFTGLIFSRMCRLMSLHAASAKDQATLQSARSHVTLLDIE